MKFVAQVEMKIVCQVEFEADETLTKNQLEDIAGDLAQAEFGDCDEFEVLELRRSNDDRNSTLPVLR